MIERTLIVIAPLGLHARAAARLVRLVNNFQSDIHLQRVDTNVSADAKSILSVLMLAASCGTRLHARAEGADEEAAIAAMDHLFASGFEEVVTSS